MTMRLAWNRVRPNPPADAGSSSICGYDTFEPNSEKPIATEARFVSSTAGRAATRRSRSGSRMRSSNQPHSSRTASPPRPSARVAGDVQPHSLPRETASSTPVRPTASPAAPAKSKRPAVRRTLGGTMRATSTNTTAPSPAAIQNSTCQSLVSVMIALTGMPTAPPTPSVADMRAIAASTRSSCSTSRMIEIPSGTTPVTAPWRARPTITPPIPGERAAITDPTMSRPSSTSTMRRLPYMSPRRPAIGVKTAAASRVAVTTHAVSSRLAFSSSGSFDWIGTTRVNMNDDARPAIARTATIAPCRGIRVSLRLSSGAIPPGYPRRALPDALSPRCARRRTRGATRPAGPSAASRRRRPTSPR